MGARRTREIVGVAGRLDGSGVVRGVGKARLRTVRIGARERRDGKSLRERTDACN